MLLSLCQNILSKIERHVFTMIQVTVITVKNHIQKVKLYFRTRFSENLNTLFDDKNDSENIFGEYKCLYNNQYKIKICFIFRIDIYIICKFIYTRQYYFNMLYFTIFLFCCKIYQIWEIRNGRRGKRGDR